MMSFRRWLETALHGGIQDVPGEATNTPMGSDIRSRLAYTPPNKKKKMAVDPDLTFGISDKDKNEKKYMARINNDKDIRPMLRHTRVYT